MRKMDLKETAALHLAANIGILAGGFAKPMLNIRTYNPPNDPEILAKAEAKRARKLARNLRLYNGTWK
jgi:hypothetical protein